MSLTRIMFGLTLAAFATVGQLTLVTFDKGLRAKAKSTVLLG